MLEFLWFVVAVAGLCGAIHIWLRPPADDFTLLAGTRVGSVTPSPENTNVQEQLIALRLLAENWPLKERLHRVREHIDKGMFGLSIDPDELGIELKEADCDGIEADWLLPPGALAEHRLLFVHGGAFVIGSRHSHRALAAEFAKRCKVAVLIFDYRLMPEHKRTAPVEDVYRAYQWMLHNGPDGAATASRTFVAGDSAGGALALTLINQLKERGARQVDAAVVLSPSTDSSGASPSMRAHVSSDPMLGPTLGKLAHVPLWLSRLGVLLLTRRRPDNSVISPIYADLTDLPPTLVHASECEMLFDDSRRWYSKARAAGTDARLETWPDMIHVWQLFGPQLPEADDSLHRIANFVSHYTNH